MTEETNGSKPKKNEKDRWSLQLDSQDKEYIMSILSENKNMVAADLMREFVKLHKKMNPQSEDELDFSDDIEDLDTTFKTILNIFNKMVSRAQTAVIDNKNKSLQQINNLKDNYEKLELEKLELQRETERLNKELESKELAIKAKDKDISKINKEKQKIWNDYQKELGHANKWFKWYQESEKKAEKAEEKLKAYENIEKENRDLIKENSMLEAQIENLHSKLSEQARLKSELEAKIKGLQKEIDNYKQKENKKIQELEIAKAAETARLKERIEQLEKLVREYRKKEEKNDFF